MTRRARTRAAVVLPVVATLLAVAGGTAYAVAQARATGTQALSPVATFGAQAQPTAATPQAGPLVLSYTVNSDRDPRTFVVRNTGSLAQSAQSWLVTVTNTGGGTKGDAAITTCRTPFTAAGTCSGPLELPAQVGIVAEGTPARFTTSNALEPGAVFHVRFAPNGVRLFTASFSMTVSRAQTSPAARTSAS